MKGGGWVAGVVGVGGVGLGWTVGLTVGLAVGWIMGLTVGWTVGCILWCLVVWWCSGNLCIATGLSRS